MIEGWDNYYQTKSLSKDEEKQVLKRVDELEKLKPRIAESNLNNNERSNLRNKLHAHNAAIKKLGQELDNIKNELNKNDDIINKYYDDNKKN